MFAHLLTTLAKLLGPGGARAIVADSLLMKQQLLIINRSRRRAPNLTPVPCELLFSPKQSAAMRLINSHHTALGTSVGRHK